MIDLSRNTLVRRYTYTDLVGRGGGGLTQDEIKRQNIQCGFDYTNKDYPIRKEADSDSVYFKQGEGPTLIGEPKITDPVDAGTTPYSYKY
jgi:hypothetical protein